MYFLMSYYLLMSSMMFFLLSIKFLMSNNKLLFNWLMMSISSIKLEMIVYFDWMSLMFFSVVTLISSMVLLYSTDYMMNHINLNRFMMLIIIFFLSMMLMIICPNMLTILLGWDGLGLSSYCLIIFYQNKKSINCGMTTILMNRVGDINILIMISLLINKNSMNFLFLNKINYFMMMCIFMTAFTKSAQIPFSIWLPMAMAAPTPVSSLVHSSTLVTAGIYLMIRFHYLLNPILLSLMMLVAISTTILASSSAIIEYDFKKIIALSTLSQLGIMLLTISMNLPKLSFFHLISHAMFKSLLFLSSGIIIHNYFNVQDIRSISLMKMNFPSINMIFNTASLTLCGLPFLSGFYSKDLIIDMYIMNNMNFFVFNYMYLCMMLTITYTFRLIFYISIKPLKIMNMNKFNMNNYMNYSIYLLFFMSVMYGSMINWLLFNNLNLVIMNFNTKMLIFNLLVTMLIFTFINMTVKNKPNKFNSTLTYFFYNMWFFQNSLKSSKYHLMKYNNQIYFSVEMTWLEYFSSKKLLFFTKNISLIMMNMNIFMIISMTLYTLLFFYLIN